VAVLVSSSSSSLADYKLESSLLNLLWETDFKDSNQQSRPFFKKSERFHPPTKEYQARHQAYYDPEAHGTDGPLHTIYSPEYGASHQYWHTTLNKLGVETSRNHASGQNVGCWTSLAGVDPTFQKRCYSAPAYYASAAKRDNLFLLAEATAREILLEEDGSDWVATGVRFAHEGKEYAVRLGREDILSAGSVQSPQLLELSGIGNPEILKAAGIDAKVENTNVGENLQEHMCKT
jgi:choline dehydrogenase-like flavoprotein